MFTKVMMVSIVLLFGATLSLALEPIPRNPDSVALFARGSAI